MAYTIVNSSDGNTYFTAGGSAITALNQPDLNKSVIAGVADSSLRKASDVGLISTYIQTVYTGFDRTSIIRGLSNTLRGSANTVIRNPASDYHREAIRQVDVVRTVRRATEIRNNRYSFFSGIFTTGLPQVNDFAAFGNDDEADSNRAIPGAFTFAYAGSGLNENYGPRTQ